MRTAYPFSVLALLWALDGAAPLHAQDLRFEHLTTAEGLPANNITAILQDHLGLMWFGTGVGLVKYDGYTFTVYRPRADDPTSISSSNINVLHEDAAGDLWIGTADGLNRLDRATERFTRYLHDPDDPASLPDNTVQALSTSAATPDVLWIGTTRGLIRFEPASGAFSPVPVDLEGVPGPLSPTVLYESPSEPGILWTGSGRSGNPESLFPGLLRFDTATGSFTSYRYDAGEPGNAILSILEDPTGTLWLGGTLGLHRFDRQTGRFEHFLPNPANPSDLNNVLPSIYLDAEGVVWAGSQGGQLGQFDPFDKLGAGSSAGSLRLRSGHALRLGSLQLRSGQAGEAPKTGMFTWHRHDPAEPTSLSPNVWISSLYPDRDGVLWIGTRGGGLNIFDPSAAPFTAHRHDPEVAQSVGAGIIRSILEDQSGALWIGTSQNGLERWDRTAGTITHYRHGPGNPRSLNYGEIVALYEDTEGVLWVGSCAGGLSRFERATETFTHYQNDPASPGSLSNCVNAIIEDRAGRFWVGTFGGGLSRFDRSTETFTRYRHDPADPQSLPGDYILAHEVDRDGAFWFGLDGFFGSTGGLVKFDPVSGHFTPYLSPHLRVMALHEDQAGRLWAGSAGNGLFRIDRRTGEYRNYTTRDGLVHDIVWAILEDDAGYLWISTDNGLSRFDPRTETFQNYDSRDGLQGNFFGERAAFKSPGGEMFFGGQAGLTSFFPDRVGGRTKSPPVVLTEFRIAGVPVAAGEDAPLKRQINVAEAVTLSHEQKDISLSFAALSYQRPEKNRYAFYLEGYEDTWGPPGPNRTATYTNLNPGTYVFRVKASNREGVWNEEGASLRIRILPPWWRTTGAYLVYGLLFLGGIFAVDRVQRRRLIAREREKARERELAQAREIEKAYHDLRETKDRLVQQEKMASLGQLTAGIAHEIKNPLNFINNFAEVNEELARELREALARGEDLREIIDDLEQNARVINQHGKRADGIVRAMMQHASGGTHRREPTDINALVSEHLDLAYHGKRARLPELQVAIERDLGDEIGPVEVVPQEIGRVLLNLLSNAFDAVHERAAHNNGQYEPTVTVTTRRTGDAVEIRVKDNGMGVPREVRDRVFEPFFTTKPAGSGTGLGLSLSYDIVTQGHGGTLTVESEDGRGAAFIVTLPVHEADAA